jgi:hypothetical protein
MKGWKQAGITAAVAYALALQALLLSFGGALHAGAANLPQAIICLPSQQPAPDHAPVDAHVLHPELQRLGPACRTRSGPGISRPSAVCAERDRNFPPGALPSACLERPACRLARPAAPRLIAKTSINRNSGQIP